jgi:hypothetical protein
MDSHNLFFTRTTSRLLRLECLAALGVCAVLAVLHISDIRWPVFIGLFLVIDLIGYLPGHVVWRLRDGSVPRTFYVLYNVMHSLLTGGLIAGLWCLIVGPEWALLALPLHLLGDRSVFGNFYKPFGLGFEPQTHPAYEIFRSSYERSVALAAVPVTVQPSSVSPDPRADAGHRIAVGASTR